LICPWNKFAVNTVEEDFAVRNGLDDISLVELFQWTKEEFDARLAGRPIRRIGYEQWLRNLAVGLGNAPTSPAVIEALRAPGRCLILGSRTCAMGFAKSR
jgi:epoxyqueuosine reductase